MTDNKQWLTITELKLKLQLLPDDKSEYGTLDFVTNPHTGKLFAVGSTATGKVKVKTKQLLDNNKPVMFMYEPGAFDEGCIVNVTPYVPTPPKFSM
jgi:hypothetical protein